MSLCKIVRTKQTKRKATTRARRSLHIREAACDLEAAISEAAAADPYDGESPRRYRKALNFLVRLARQALSTAHRQR